MSSPGLELVFCELEIGRPASLVSSWPKASWTESPPEDEPWAAGEGRGLALRGSCRSRGIPSGLFCLPVPSNSLPVLSLSSSCSLLARRTQEPYPGSWRGWEAGVSSQWEP